MLALRRTKSTNPVPSQKTKQVIYESLKNALCRLELFTIIASEIKKEYKNVAALLKAVISAEIKPKDKLSKKEVEALEYYSDKIQTEGLEGSNMGS